MLVRAGAHGWPCIFHSGAGHWLWGGGLRPACPFATRSNSVSEVLTAAGVFDRQVSGPHPTLWAGGDNQLSLSLARGLGVTQASWSITRRARKANGLCQGTWRASGRAHASPRGGEGEQRGGGKGFDSPFFVFFSRVGPHHPHRQTLLAKLSLLPGLTSTFRSRCGQHVCSFFTRQRLGEWSPGAPGAV